jgi:predicted dithiol-disulfide oxidoreductase (DUF899 family)
VFEEGSSDLNDATTSRKVRMSESFAPGKDTLAIYSYMFGPKMNEPCVSCTSILDGLNGTTRHATERINLVAVAKSPLERIRAVARDRGWNEHLRPASWQDSSFL